MTTNLTNKLVKLKLLVFQIITYGFRFSFERDEPIIFGNTNPNECLGEYRIGLKGR